MAMAAAGEMRASLAFVERNVNLVKRYWAWEVVWILYTIANSLAVVLIARSVNAAAGSQAALDDAAVDRLVLFLTIGAVVWHYFALVFHTVSEMIALERWEGTIEYTFMAPIRRSTHMVGVTLFSIVYGVVHSAAILAFVVLVFDLEIAGANYPSALAVLAAGSLSLIGIGIMGSVATLLYPERGAQMAGMFQAALVLISGVYALPSAMPEPLHTLSYFSPATYLISGIRDAIIHGASLAQLWPTVLGLFVAGLAIIPFGVWVFSVGERRAKRNGKLKRSG